MRRERGRDLMWTGLRLPWRTVLLHGFAACEMWVHWPFLNGRRSTRPRFACENTRPCIADRGSIALRVETHFTLPGCVFDTLRTAATTHTIGGN
jgi:hypothetical protein